MSIAGFVKAKVRSAKLKPIIAGRQRDVNVLKRFNAGGVIKGFEQPRLRRVLNEQGKKIRRNTSGKVISVR